MEAAFRPPPTVWELTQARAPKRRRTISAWSLSAATCREVHPRHESSTWRCPKSRRQAATQAASPSRQAVPRRKSVNWQKDREKERVGGEDTDGPILPQMRCDGCGCEKSQSQRLHRREAQARQEGQQARGPLEREEPARGPEKREKEAPRQGGRGVRGRWPGRPSGENEGRGLRRGSLSRGGRERGDAGGRRAD